MQAERPAWATSTSERDMRTDVEAVSEDQSRPARRRRAVITITRSLVVATAIVVGYFLLPMTSPIAIDTLFELTLGLFALGALLTWEIFGILRSPYPGVQAVATLVTTLPLFLTIFATSYFLMEHAAPGSFSEHLTRLDSMYFTVTTFATVGYGDITAVSEPARAVATMQMLLGLVLVGLIARLVLAAVQEARTRRVTDRSPDRPDRP